MIYYDIDYTSIINSFVSTEGSGGFMTNYIYYSVLVVYKSGRKEIVEGRLNQIQDLLRYIRTPQDELQKQTDALDNQLSSITRDIRQLRTAVEAIQNAESSRIDYIIDSLYPIPDLKGMNEADAVELLCSSDFIPVMINSYPPSTAKNGVVRSYSRGSHNFKEVLLDVIHILPDIVGLPVDDALRILDEEGFSYSIEKKLVKDSSSEKVIQCERDNELAMSVSLTVSINLPNLKMMDYHAAVTEVEKNGLNHQDRWVYSTNDETDKIKSWSFISDDTISLVISKGAAPPPPEKNAPALHEETSPPEESVPAHSTDAKTEVKNSPYYCSVCHIDMEQYYGTCPYCGSLSSIKRK